jgi:hypothetical protein
MGSSLALFLARRGVQVTLIDKAAQPLTAASRWNEGKIHLGYLYSADQSLRTADALLPGGLSFKRLTEELIGCSLERATTQEDDLYLVHRESVVTPDVVGRYFEEVSTRARSHPDGSDYFVNLAEAKIRALSSRQLETLADTRRVVAGFRVPERSVSTNWIADRYVEALAAEPGIQLVLNTRVIAARPVEDSLDGCWHLNSKPILRGSFDYVINALWEGKLLVDVKAGLNPEAGWSHRYRLAVFVHTSRELDVQNAVVAVGPFGDVKNYTGRDFYLSWYPVGLVAQGEALSPPALPDFGRLLSDSIIESVAGELGSLIPAVTKIIANGQTKLVEGGWVFAIGQGALSNPLSTLHRRHEFGFRRRGSYVSVDTGKYSVAPWLARRIVDELCDNRG